MFKIKKYRKESTDPAQLVDSVEQAARQAKENLAWLIAGVVVAVLAGAAVGGFLWMRQQDDRAAADLFYEATQQVSEPSQTGAPPAPRRSEDLQKAIETFRKILTDFPNSSVAPQAAYLLGNALSERKDWDGAIKAYQDFLARYGANRLFVQLALRQLHIGHALIDQRNEESVGAVAGQKILVGLDGTVPVLALAQGISQKIRDRKSVV